MNVSVPFFLGVHGRGTGNMSHCDFVFPVYWLVLIILRTTTHLLGRTPRYHIPPSFGVGRDLRSPSLFDTVPPEGIGIPSLTVHYDIVEGCSEGTGVQDPSGLSQDGTVCSRCQLKWLHRVHLYKLQRPRHPVSVMAFGWGFRGPWLFI